LNIPKLIAILRYRVNEMQTLHNETQTMLQETKHTLKDILTRNMDDTENRIAEATEGTKNSVTALR